MFVCAFYTRARVCTCVKKKKKNGETENETERNGKVSHLSEALFEFTCTGELPLAAPAAFEGGEGGGGGGADDNGSSAGGTSQQTSPSSSSSDASSAGGGGDDDSTALGAAALAAAYPTEFPRVLPSGCAFEASLDGAAFEAVPNTVSLTGLSNGDHRFSVRWVRVSVSRRKPSRRVASLKWCACC